MIYVLVQLLYLAINASLGANKSLGKVSLNNSRSSRESLTQLFIL